MHNELIYNIHVFRLGELQNKTADDLEVLKSTMDKWNKDDLEKKCQKLGFAFGSQFDLLKEGWSSGTEALGVICPTKEINEGTEKYTIHPSIIDASFQTMLLLKGNAGKFVPQQITNLTIVDKPDNIEQLFAHTKILEWEENPTATITLMDSHARPVMIIESLATAEISRNKAKISFENSSFSFGWEEFTSKAYSDNQESVWLLLRDKSKFAERFLQYVPAEESVHFVDLQDTAGKARDEFAKALDDASAQVKGNRKLRVLNFWPVDTSKFDVDTRNFDVTHSLAFESCLLIAQEITKREALAKKVHLVFVTSGLVTIIDDDQSPVTDLSNVFPWSATVFGFRRSFSEEINLTKASVVDLSINPSNKELNSLAEDVKAIAMEEEIVYRDGVRYVNRFKHLVPLERKCTETEPLFSKISYKMASMSGEWYLRKRSNKMLDPNKEIDVYYACPITQKPWKKLKMNDRVAFAGKLFDDKQNEDEFLVVGVCDIQDLGSTVDAMKCCFSKLEEDITLQQAASLVFPLVMSYHILTNIIGNVEEKKILFFHTNEEVSTVFSLVALSLGAKVTCLVKNRADKERMQKFGDVEVLTEDELAKSKLRLVNEMNFDAVCFLGHNSAFSTRQIMKHLKRDAIVITVHGEGVDQFNRFIASKNVQFMTTNLEKITENSNTFSELLKSCCSVLKSNDVFEKLLGIPQQVFSIYDVMEHKCEIINFEEKNDDIYLETVSMKPKVLPGSLSFYNLPLDESGMKDDCTYLVIGGVRGFGFEIAKWMVENGAKTVMCTARSAPNEEKKAYIQHLQEETGSRILLRQADVTSWEDMYVIKKELEHLPPVAGIVFTAMVLQDQLVKDADVKTCKKVVETKVKGNNFAP